MVQYHALAKIDRCVIRHTIARSDLHQDHVAYFERRVLGQLHKTSLGEALRVQVARSVIPPVIFSSKLLQNHAALAGVPVNDQLIAIQHAMRELAPDQQRLVAGRFDGHQLAGQRRAVDLVAPVDVPR